MNEQILASAKQHEEGAAEIEKTTLEEADMREDACEFHTMVQYSETTLLESVDTFSHYLNIDYMGDTYYGGAHGMPFTDHLTVDLDAGKIVRFLDVYDGDEETLKEIVAQAVLRDHENNPDVYFPEDEQELYDEVYESIDIDYVDQLGYFTEDGYVVEFYPYHLSPYGAGILEIRIPYEQLPLKKEMK